MQSSMGAECIERHRAEHIVFQCLPEAEVKCVETVVQCPRSTH